MGNWTLVHGVATAPPLWFGFQNPPLAASAIHTQSRRPVAESHATSCSSSLAFGYHDGCWSDILEKSVKNERWASKQWREGR